MKKTFLTIAILLLCALTVFAEQTMYRRNSEEVEAFYSLRHLTHDQTPDPVFPITGSQLADLVRHLDKSKLSGYSLDLYNDLLNKLENPEHYAEYEKAWIDFAMPFHISLKGRTSDVAFDENSFKYQLFDMRDIPTGHGFDGTVGIGENFAGRMDYILLIRETLGLWNDKFSFISPFHSFKEHEEEHKPHYVYASLGNDILNLAIGRDRTSAGNGKIGNLGFGDTLYYQNYAKFSAVSYPFSYDLTVYEFDNQNGSNQNKDIDVLYHNKAYQAVVSHRFSMAIAKFLNLSVYESALTYGDTYAVINAINPFMILHNTYAFDESNNNNFFGAEINASIKNFEVSLNFMLDQFQFDFEIKNIGGASVIAPNAYALQLNTTSSWALKKGILDTYVEAVYTSPVCYLKEEKGKFKNGTPWYTQDLLVGTSFSSLGSVRYLGFKYGPDTIALGLGASYKANKWSLKSDFTFLAQGSFGLRHDMILFGSDFDMTEEQSLKYLNAFSPFVFNGESVEYTAIATINGSYQYSDFVKVNGGFGYIHVTNYGNEADKKLDDCQFTLSATIDLAPLVKKAYKHFK